MRFFALALLLLASTPPARAADPCYRSYDFMKCPQNFLPKPGPPSAYSKTEIEKLLMSAQPYESTEKIARKVAAKSKAKLDGKPRPIIGDSSEWDREMDAYVEALKKANAAQHKRYEIYNKAIELIIPAYQLSPRITDPNALNPGPLSSNITYWWPRYSEREIQDSETSVWRRRTDTELMQEAAKRGGNIREAKMRLNGEIVLWHSLFKPPDGSTPPDVDKLASVILHETSHWIDRVSTAGLHWFLRDTWLSEVLAYTRQADFLAALGKDDSIKRSQAKEYANRLKATEGMGETQIQEKFPQWYLDTLNAEASYPTDSDPSAHPDPEDEKIRGELDFLNSLKGKTAPVLGRKEQDIAQDRERRAQQEESDKQFRWDRLKFWTHRACDNYMNTRDQEVARIGRAYVLSHYAILPRDEVVEQRARDKANLNSCQRDLIDLILSAPGPLDVDFIMQKIDYERSGGRLGEILRGATRSISRAIADGTAVIVKTISAPFAGTADDARRARSSPGRSGPSSGSGGRDEPNAPPSSGRFNDGPAYQRLRGIASGAAFP